MGKTIQINFHKNGIVSTEPLDEATHDIMQEILSWKKKYHLFIPERTCWIEERFCSIQYRYYGEPNELSAEDPDQLKTKLKEVLDKLEKLRYIVTHELKGYVHPFILRQHSNSSAFLMVYFPIALHKSFLHIVSRNAPFITYFSVVDNTVKEIILSPANLKCGGLAIPKNNYIGTPIQAEHKSVEIPLYEFIREVKEAFEKEKKNYLKLRRIMFLT